MMIKIQCLVLCFLGVLISESYSGVVSFIKPCPHDDDSCLVSSAQAAVKYLAQGIPELNIPPSEPLYIKSVNNNGPNLKLEFSDVHISGVSQAKILKLSRNVKENTFKLVLSTPIHAKGKYVLDGKVFLINAVGDGDFEMNSDGIDMEFLLRIKDFEKDGKKYWKIIGYDYIYNLINKVYIKLDNLFGGDKKKAEPIEKILDEAWKELVEEIGDKLFHDVTAIYVDHVKKFFLGVPYEELEIKKN